LQAPKVVRPAGRASLRIEMQPQNAPLRMVVRVAGRATWVSLMQPLKLATCCRCLALGQ